MPQLGQVVKKIRSKNAGPFWLTIDIFCKNEENFRSICERLSNKRVAALFHIEAEELKRFDISALNVIKFSLPRPQVQGTLYDRDMHGAAYAVLLEEFGIE